VNPARLLGLPAGRLARGAPADVVVFDPDAPVVIDADRLLSKSKNSPFDGRRLQGRVLLTLAAGRIVHDAR
jgi:dihydroorotase